MDWKATEEPIGISVGVGDDEKNFVCVAGLRDYKLTRIVLDLPNNATVATRTTGGIWMGKFGARPGLFAIGDMTGYVYDKIVKPKS